MMNKLKKELEISSSYTEEIDIKRLQEINTSIIILSNYLDRLQDFELYKLER